jgi:hypothetical protein
MITNYGILGYCSNIHPGEIWDEHFTELQKYLPEIKKQVCPEKSFGFGLRIANLASIELCNQPEKIKALKDWLSKEDLFVYTLNGFPFGGFHHAKVKDEVHKPDWTSIERLEYTKRLADILVEIMPNDLSKAGISTSPLSYTFWWKANEMPEAFRRSTNQIVELALYLHDLKAKTGKSIHLDIEPEPDGLLGNHQDFIRWYEEDLLGNHVKLEAILREHIQICFDVCHYGVSFDNIENALNELKSKGIGVGKIQISSALKVDLSTNFEQGIAALTPYQEPIYLHQVRAIQHSNQLVSFKDLDVALEEIDPTYKEARVHFHVPIFLESFGRVESTQHEINKCLAYQKLHRISDQMEIETYTWGVLPKEFQKPMEESIAREINWVLRQLD